MTLQKEWLDYINRLQERERQKIASGGLSNWVLLLALLGLAYWIYPDIVDIKKHWWIVLTGYIIFTNFTITFFDIFNNNFRQEKIKKYYSPTSIIDIKGTKILKVVDFIINISNLLLNICFCILSLQEGANWLAFYFFLYISRYLLSFMQDSLFFMKNHLEKTDEEFNDKLNSIKSKIDNNSLQKKVIGFLIKVFFGNTIKILASLFFIKYVFTSYDFNDILWKSLFNGLGFVIMIVLFQFLLLIFIKRIKIAWLEQLEQEIILKNLSPEQIIRQLKKHYFNSSNIDNYF